MSHRLRQLNHLPSPEMLVLYATEDGKSRIQLCAKDHTVWLCQREMAQLFDVSTDNIGLHLKNLYEDGELIREATTEEFSAVQSVWPAVKALST